mmetsp:Transcript_4678/g.10183  ORF Transcript_4678/g.10183 Transcript_4678/m.10183 type:complete len:156 (-) Transcript_4678:323-790(-)
MSARGALAASQLRAALLSSCVSARPPLYSALAIRTAQLPLRPLVPRTRSLSMLSLPPHLEDMREELATDEAQLFDVREPQETAAGKLKDAKLVPLSDLQHGVAPPCDKTKLTYLHCAAGIRVHYAAPILESMGFERVVPLQEGYATLKASGFEST